jgi:hypothetical protein
MKLREVLKKSAVAIVAGVVVNSLANAIFPRKEFSLFPTLSAMGAVIIGSSSSYNLYKNVLISNLIYTLACLTEIKLGISLVSLPFFIAMLSFVVIRNKTKMNRSLVAVSNFPRLEKVYNESKLKEKVSLFKEKVKNLEFNIVHREDLNLVEQIIRTRKFIAYKKDNSVKLIYEYSENLPNLSAKTIKRVRDEEINNELILNEIYEKASPSPPSLVLPIGEKKVQIPSSYSKGKLVILDQEGKINLHELKKINEKTGWVELGRNPLINFIKIRLFSSKATFSISTKDEPRNKVDLMILIRRDFQENEISNVVVSVPRHLEKLSSYLGFENLEPFNENIILYSKKDGLLFLLKGDKR